MVVVEEGPKTGGVSAEIAAGIMERLGDSLLAPVVRVASADVPVPFTPVLEDAYRPDRARIIAAVRKLAGSTECSVSPVTSRTAHPGKQGPLAESESPGATAADRGRRPCV